MLPFVRDITELLTAVSNNHNNRRHPHPLSSKNTATAISAPTPPATEKVAIIPPRNKNPKKKEKSSPTSLPLSRNSSSSDQKQQQQTTTTTKITAATSQDENERKRSSIRSSSFPPPPPPLPSTPIRRTTSSSNNNNSNCNTLIAPAAAPAADNSVNVTMMRQRMTGVSAAAGSPASGSTASSHHHQLRHNQRQQQHNTAMDASTTQQQQHNNNNNNSNNAFVHNLDDADVAAGKLFSTSHRQLSSNTLSSLETAPASVCTINTKTGHPGDLEFFEDLITEPVLVLGVDISHLHKSTQFAVCACGLFFFSLLYGYLQELLSVQLCSRQLGLFLAMMQFSGYTGLAWILRNFVYQKQQQALAQQQQQGGSNNGSAPSSAFSMSSLLLNRNNSIKSHNNNSNSREVPLYLYVRLALLRAIDLAMTNLAMQYINYPAKTLMKSSRVVFTMLFGVLIQRKVYKTMDYIIVLAMVVGLGMFMHADSHSSAVFHHWGVIMLTISLICDGAISNMSETIMSQYGVGQDEFIFRLYSISLVAITAAAAFKGDLYAGMVWIFQPGTYQEYLDGTDERSYSGMSKIFLLVLFSSMGFFGSSCSAAITKNFGALTMSITSTARKATTLFLSFFLFNNVCTSEHIAGIVVFIAALTTKSMRRRNASKKKKKKKSKKYRKYGDYVQLVSAIPPSSHLDLIGGGGGNITNNDTTDVLGSTTNPTTLRFRPDGNNNDDALAPPTSGNHPLLVHVV